MRLPSAISRVSALVAPLCAAVVAAFASAPATAAPPTSALLTFVAEDTVDRVDAEPGDCLCASAVGTCTARAALMEAHACPAGPHLVVVRAGRHRLQIPGPGGLEEGDLDVTGVVTVLMAPDASISASRLHRTPWPDRVLHVHEGGRLTLHGGMLSGGGSDALDGGLVLNEGDLYAASSWWRHGAAAMGGALYNAGTAALVDCTVAANDALFGGGIASEGDLQLAASAVLHNRASLGGGALALESGATAALVRTWIAHNHAEQWAGGGIYSEGVLSLDQVTVTDNHASPSMGGGGLAVSIASGWGGGPGAVVARSSIYRNSAGAGGGVYVELGATLELADTTVAVNTSHGAGGGVHLHNAGEVTITNSTITRNRAHGVDGWLAGAGLAAHWSPAVSVANSIVSDNALIGASEGADCWTLSSTISSASGNVFGHSDHCGAVAGDAVASAGLTGFTSMGEAGDGHFPLAPGSPAVDSGSDCTGTDQMGQPRGPVCDAGAIESGW